MNKFRGHITEVEVSGSLSQVSVSLGGDVVLKSIVIETPDSASYLLKDTSVNVIFKETEVILAKGDHICLSLLNRIEGEVTQIKRGTLLCEILVDTTPGPLTAIIDSEAVDAMELKPKDKVVVLVKQNEVMLAE